MNGGQDIERDVMLLQQLDALHHPLEGRGAAFVYAIMVVQFLRAIQTDTDQELMFPKEPAPFLIECDGVGLQRIQDAHAGPAVFRLQGHRLAEKIQSHQGGFTPLPGKTDFGMRLGADVLLDVFFEHWIRHAEITARKQRFFFEKITILAIQVANGTPGLGHDMERKRGSRNVFQPWHENRCSDRLTPHAFNVLS